MSLVKLFVLYSIPYAALRLVGCTALNFAQAQMLASLMLLITSALPNVAGVGPMEFAFLLLFAPWADTGNRLVGAGTLSRGDVFLPVPSERDRVSPRGEEIFERL